jgi:hypothetical protein
MDWQTSYTYAEKFVIPYSLSFSTQQHFVYVLKMGTHDIA